MSEKDKPVVTIAHALPGRLRVQLSMAPKEKEKLISAVMEHSGMQSVQYNHLTHSVLVHYDQKDVAQEEIVLRIALVLSIDYGVAPVRILTRTGRRAFSGSTVFSAILLGAALASRIAGHTVRKGTKMDWIAGSGTALAVAHHGWKELRERGYFDPEVLSLAYLFTAFSRGNFLKASLVTWLMAFGRHLVESPHSGVEVRPMEIQEQGKEGPRYEVVVGPDRDSPQSVRILNSLQALVKFALTGGGANARRNLLDELRDVSKVHGEVLEELERMPIGIPLRFE